MFPQAFVAGWLQGHWWGFISRNYVVWPTFLLMNVFIALKGSHFWFLFFQTAIVCGVLPDGILGQDFMLKFASRIDYKKMLIETSANTKPCWVGGESESVSNVVLQDTVKIPPWSCHHVTVDISKADILSDTGLLQSSGSLLKSKEVCLVEGIVDTSSRQATVQIVNIGESEATIFSGTPVGICESYYAV